MATNNNSFDQYLKLAAFQSITDKLKEQNLITEEEYQSICQRIRKMEQNLLKPIPAGNKQTKIK